MEDLKQYLSNDADEQERAAAEKIRAGLSGLRLEAKVAAVAAERQAWLRRRSWQRLTVVLATLVVLAGAVFLFFREKETPVLPPPTQIQPSQEPGNQQNIVPETPDEITPGSRKSVPMASNQSPQGLPDSRYPAPNIRGENSEEDKAWQTRLNQIWYTDYPPNGLVVTDTFKKADQLLRARDFTSAYVQLQRLERNLPANDTLRFLKGYCLLEMGEGTEALTYFEKLEQRHPDWEMQLQWYRGLGLLLTGDQQKALIIFKDISSVARHTYQQQSKRAIQLLE